jgi:hypothetical protein
VTIQQVSNVVQVLEVGNITGVPVRVCLYPTALATPRKLLVIVEMFHFFTLEGTLKVPQTVSKTLLHLHLF